MDVTREVASKVCVRIRVSMYLGTRLHVHVNKRSDAILRYHVYMHAVS